MSIHAAAIAPAILKVSDAPNPETRADTIVTTEGVNIYSALLLAYSVLRDADDPIDVTVDI
jgi:hypothetical protein